MRISNIIALCLLMAGICFATVGGVTITRTSPASTPIYTNDTTPTLTWAVTGNFTTYLCNISQKVGGVWNVRNGTSVNNDTARSWELPASEATTTNGDYDWRINCSEPGTEFSSLRNTSEFTLRLDTVVPSGVYRVDTPTNGSYFTGSTIWINVTTVDSSAEFVNISVYHQGVLNKTGRANVSVGFNGTSLTGYADGSRQIEVRLVDDAANWASLGLINFTSDNTVPIIGNVTFIEKGDVNIGGYILANFTAFDMTAFHSVGLNVYNLTKHLVTSVTPISRVSGAYYEFNITSSVIGSQEGSFRFEAWAKDNATNTIHSANQSNFTSTPLYTGWNFITVPKNYTCLSLRDAMNESITYIALWNRTKGFELYVAGLDTHNESVIPFGTSAVVYVNNTKSFVRNASHISGESVAPTGVLNLTYGWNLMHFYNQSGLTLLQFNGTIDGTIYNNTRVAGAGLEVIPKILGGNVTSNVSATHFAYYDASATTNKYLAYYVGYTPNKNVWVPFGRSVWMRLSGINNATVEYRPAMGVWT